MSAPVSVVPSVKSTNVRAYVAQAPRRLHGGTSAIVGLARRVFPLLEAHAEGTGSALAEWLFFRPWRKARNEPWPEGGRDFSIGVAGDRLRGRAWGEAPYVFLMHGWEGTARQMGAFVAPLLARGLGVVAWDAPAHGASGGGRSSMVHFARGLQAMAERFGPPQAVIAHSLGGAAAALAARRGLPIGRLVTVGTPARPTDWVTSFARELRIGPRTVAGMKARAERRLGIGWHELVTPALLAGVDVPVLVVHDVDDREVAYADAEEIVAAASGAELVATAGLGHRRILKDPGVVARVVEFAATGPRPPAWDAATLEAEMFERPRRWPAAA